MDADSRESECPREMASSEDLQNAEAGLEETRSVAVLDKKRIETLEKEADLHKKSAEKWMDRYDSMCELVEVLSGRNNIAKEKFEASMRTLEAAGRRIISLENQLANSKVNKNLNKANGVQDDEEEEEVERLGKLITDSLVEVVKDPTKKPDFTAKMLEFRAKMGPARMVPKDVVPPNKWPANIKKPANSNNFGILDARLVFSKRIPTTDFDLIVRAGEVRKNATSTSSETMRGRKRNRDTEKESEKGRVAPKPIRSQSVRPRQVSSPFEPIRRSSRVAGLEPELDVPLVIPCRSVSRKSLPAPPRSCSVSKKSLPPPPRSCSVARKSLPVPQKESTPDTQSRELRALKRDQIRLEQENQAKTKNEKKRPAPKSVGSEPPVRVTRMTASVTSKKKISEESEDSPESRTTTRCLRSSINVVQNDLEDDATSETAPESGAFETLVGNSSNAANFAENDPIVTEDVPEAMEIGEDVSPAIQTASEDVESPEAVSEECVTKKTETKVPKEDDGGLEIDEEAFGDVEKVSEALSVEGKRSEDVGTHSGTSKSSEDVESAPEAFQPLNYTMEVFTTPEAIERSPKNQRLSEGDLEVFTTPGPIEEDPEHPLPSDDVLDVVTTPEPIRRSPETQRPSEDNMEVFMTPEPVEEDQEHPPTSEDALNVVTTSEQIEKLPEFSKANEKKSNKQRLFELGLEISDSEEEEEAQEPPPKRETPKKAGRKRKAPSEPSTSSAATKTMLIEPRRRGRPPKSAMIAEATVAVKEVSQKKQEKTTALLKSHLRQAFDLKLPVNELARPLEEKGIQLTNDVLPLTPEDAVDVMIHFLRESPSADMWAVLRRQRANGVVELINKEEENFLQVAVSLNKDVQQVLEVFIRRIVAELAMRRSIDSKQLGRLTRLFCHAIHFSSILEAHDKATWMHRFVDVLLLKHTSHFSKCLAYCLVSNAFPFCAWLAEELEDGGGQSSELSLTVRILVSGDSDDKSVVNWLLNSRFQSAAVSRPASEQIGASFSAAIQKFLQNDDLKPSLMLAKTGDSECLHVAFRRLEMEMKRLEEHFSHYEIETEEQKHKSVFTMTSSQRLADSEAELLQKEFRWQHAVLSLMSSSSPRNTPPIMEALRKISMQIVGFRDVISARPRSEHVRGAIDELAELVDGFTNYPLDTVGNI